MSNESQSKSAIATVTRGPGGLELRTFADVWSFSQCLVKSGMAPPGLDTVEQVVIAIEMGAEIGLKAMQAVQGIAVINKKPCVYGDSMLGTCQASKVWDERVSAEWYTGTYPNDDYAAHCRVGRVGAESPVECTFSVADAKQAGLWGKAGPWTNYTKRQMMWRARTWACRNAFADVLKGLKVAEEVQDYSDVIDASTQPSLPAPSSRGDAIAMQAARPEPEPTVITGPPVSPKPPLATAVTTSEPAEPPTITREQLDRLAEAYNKLDEADKAAVRKALDFDWVSDFTNLPQSKYVEVLAELTAAYKMPDEAPKPTTDTPAVLVKLTKAQYDQVHAKYMTLDDPHKISFRIFALASADAMISHLYTKTKGSIHTYEQLMAWFDVPKGE